MKYILILLLICCSQIANSQWFGYEDSGRQDTVKAKFVVSSDRYEMANIKIMSGYLVREIFEYTQDKIPCEDCDYSPNYIVMEYLNSKRKPIVGYTVWKYKMD
jgi:hypothetical protein